MVARAGAHGRKGWATSKVLLNISNRGGSSTAHLAVSVFFSWMMAWLLSSTTVHSTLETVAQHKLLITVFHPNYSNCFESKGFRKITFLQKLLWTGLSSRDLHHHFHALNVALFLNLLLCKLDQHQNCFSKWKVSCCSS